MILDAFKKVIVWQFLEQCCNVSLCGVHECLLFEQIEKYITPDTPPPCRLPPSAGCGAAATTPTSLTTARPICPRPVAASRLARHLTGAARSRRAFASPASVPAPPSTIGTLMSLGTAGVYDRRQRSIPMPTALTAAHDRLRQVLSILHPPSPYPNGPV